MEKVFEIRVEKLPEGDYLATSDTIPGLVAQGRTIAETLSIAGDVAAKLLEFQSADNFPVSSPGFDFWKDEREDIYQDYLDN